MGVSITRRRLLFLAWEIFRHDQLYSQGTIALSTTYNLEREGSALSLAPESFFSQGKKKRGIRAGLYGHGRKFSC